MHSKWDATGAGRANVEFTDGDLGSTRVLFSECWNSQFYRTFYVDNRNINPKEGNVSSCVFP